MNHATLQMNGERTERKGFSIDGVRFEPDWRDQGEQQVRNPYRQNVWVYAAITAKARNIASVPFVVRSSKGGPVVESGPIAEVFRSPSPLYVGQSDFFGTISIFLDMFGEAPIYAPGLRSGSVPVELYIVQPSRLTEAIDPKTGIILGWTIAAGSNGGHSFGSASLTAEELGLVKLTNPENLYRGLSPLEAVRFGLDFELAAAQYNAALLKNGGAPGGIITMPSGLSKDEIGAVRKSWEDRHKGALNAGRVSVLTEGMTWSAAAQSAKDMQFGASREWSRDEVKAALGVTDFELGATLDYNRASAEAAAAWFWHNTLIPRLVHIQTFVNVWILEPLNLYGEFDLSTIEALRYEWTERLQSIPILAPYYGINDIAERLGVGMPKVAWGNEPAGMDLGAGADAATVPDGAPAAVPEGATAVQDTALNGAQVTSLVDIVAQVQAGTLPAESAIGLILVSFPTVDEAEARRIILAAAAKQPGQAVSAKSWRIRSRMLSPKAKAQRQAWQAKSERIMRSAARSYFRGLRDLARKNAGAGKAAYVADPDRVLGSPGAWKRVAEDSFGGAMRAVTSEALKQMAREGFAVIPPPSAFLRSIQKRTAQMVRVSQRDRAKLGARLRKAIDEGGISDVGSMRKEIDSFFGTQSSARSVTIARTESGMLGSDVRQQTFEDNGIDEVEWNTSSDGHVRPSHAALEGERRKLGAKFSNGLTRPCEAGAPAAEVIACRCVLLPVN